MSSLPQNTITCPSCGHSNSRWRTTCENCSSSLLPSETPTSADVTSTQRRPGFVTAYVVLSAAASIALLVILLTTTPFNQSLAFLFLGVAGTLYNVVILWGLWTLQNWARILVIGSNCLSIIMSMFYGLLGREAGLYRFSTLFCGVLVGLGLAGFIIYWFASNGDYFE